MTGCSRCSSDEFLLRVLAAALGGNVGLGALNDLEQGLLHALAGNIAGVMEGLSPFLAILSISSM
jgi:hypothetical protein